MTENKNPYPNQCSIHARLYAPNNTRNPSLKLPSTSATMLRMAFLSVEDTDKTGSTGSLHELCQKAHEFDFSVVSGCDQDWA